MTDKKLGVIAGQPLDRSPLGLPLLSGFIIGRAQRISGIAFAVQKHCGRGGFGLAAIIFTPAMLGGS